MRRTIGLVAVCGVLSVTSACDTDRGDSDDDGPSNQGSASAVAPHDTESESETEDTEDGTESDTEDDAESDTEDDAESDTQDDAESDTQDEPEPEAEPCDAASDGRGCSVDGEWCGIQQCEDGYWGECNETADCGGGTSTPLVLSFDGAQPQLVAMPTAAFDNDVAGGCLSTDWPSAATPWLALDRDGDGGISDGRELFGSGTRLAGGHRAANGFAALTELDADRNGKITPADPRFAELVLWADHDGDKRGAGSELRSLGELRVLSLELAYDVDRVCDARGNCGVERAVFTFADDGGAITQGRVIDVHLACQ